MRAQVIFMLGTLACLASANTHSGTRHVRDTTYAPPRSEYYAPPKPVYHPPPTPIYHATPPPRVLEVPAPPKPEYAPPRPEYEAPISAYGVPAPPKSEFAPPPPEYEAPTSAYGVPAPPKSEYEAPTQEYGVPAAVETEFVKSSPIVDKDLDSPLEPNSFTPAVEPVTEPKKEDNFSEDVQTTFSNVDDNQDFTPDKDLEVPKSQPPQIDVRFSHLSREQDFNPGTVARKISFKRNKFTGPIFINTERGFVPLPQQFVNPTSAF